MYSIAWSKSAAKEIRKVPIAHRTVIVRKIAMLANDPRPVGCAKLSGHDRLYRFRQGNYRVIYDVEDERLIVIVVEVRHRKDVYRGY